jgi:alkylhydroperoxidase/carboxymuconolactone decarboxylase family protein YurZ
VAVDEAADGAAMARTLFGDERYERTRLAPGTSRRAELLALADEVVFGQVYTRSGLTLDQRSLCTIAALTVLGYKNQLRAHINGALNIGLPREAIAEVIVQMAMYGGFPAALNAMQVADECFAETDARDA